MRVKGRPLWSLPTNRNLLLSKKKLSSYDVKNRARKLTSALQLDPPLTSFFLTDRSFFCQPQSWRPNSAKSFPHAGNSICLRRSVSWLTTHLHSVTWNKARAWCAADMQVSFRLVFLLQVWRSSGRATDTWWGWWRPTSGRWEQLQRQALRTSSERGSPCSSSSLLHCSSLSFTYGVLSLLFDLTPNHHCKCGGGHLLSLKYGSWDWTTQWRLRSRRTCVQNSAFFYHLKVDSQVCGSCKRTRILSASFPSLHGGCSPKAESLKPTRFCTNSRRRISALTLKMKLTSLWFVHRFKNIMHICLFHATESKVATQEHCSHGQWDRRDTKPDHNQHWQRLEKAGCQLSDRAVEEKPQPNNFSRKKFCLFWI